MKEVTMLAATSQAEVIGGYLGLIAGIAAYFIPTIIAAVRGLPNMGSIAIVDVFLGWTIIGWIIALAMACGSRPYRYGQQPPAQWQGPPR
jgi:Superinfection immunity protein